jgi:hypothetical protein
MFMYIIYDASAEVYRSVHVWSAAQTSDNENEVQSKSTETEEWFMPILFVREYEAGWRCGRSLVHQD